VRAKYWLQAALLLALAGIAGAQPPEAARTEIDHLIQAVADSGCQFFRNDSWYDSKSAAEHLRYKYGQMLSHDLINSTQDFIDKVATKSNASGRDYAMKCAASAPVATATWLNAELKRYRSFAPP
jgi:hypothetical protein